MLLVRLLVNRRLVVVKLWGSEKLFIDLTMLFDYVIWLCRWSVPLIPTHIVRVNHVFTHNSFIWLKKIKRHKGYTLKTLPSFSPSHLAAFQTKANVTIFLYTPQWHFLHTKARKIFFLLPFPTNGRILHTLFCSVICSQNHVFKTILHQSSLICPAA